MLSPVVMHLRHKFLTRLNSDTSNEVIFAAINHIIFSPGAENFLMLFIFVPIIPF